MRKWTSPKKSSGEFIVPAKAVNELNRFVAGQGRRGNKFGENQASFALKDDKGFFRAARHRN